MVETQGKAWTYNSTKGGLVENLRLTDHHPPSVKPDHILIEVLSVSLNPGDYKFPDIPIIGRFVTRPASPCWDFCGRIKALPDPFPNDSRKLSVGQVVFGMHRDLKALGTLKTTMWVHQDAVYPLPETIPVDHGAALGVGALTAYQAIAPHAVAGGKVLVNGGAGGVGTFCIQIAKALGMSVVATCSEAGAQLCLDLGADEILDYKSPTFQSDLHRTQVDLVVDNVGNDPQFHRRSESFLKSDGHFVLVALMDRDWAGLRSMLSSWMLPTWLGGPARRWRVVFTQSKIENYKAVAELARDNRLRVVVDSVFSFDDVPKAFERLKSGRAKGKIMVIVKAD